MQRLFSLMKDHWETKPKKWMFLHWDQMMKLKKSLRRFELPRFIWINFCRILHRNLKNILNYVQVAMINISLWVIAWTPFTVICLLGLHGDQKLLTPLVSTLPIFFAKSSCLYNPIIYGTKSSTYFQFVRKYAFWNE